MMKYDFDRVIDRSVTNDMKWHTGPVRSYLNVEVREDMIPMWIADMDFACPPCVVEAVKARAEKEIYGYCAPGVDYFKAVTYWYKSRYGIALDPTCICVVPSVVGAINAAIRAFTQPGEGVIIQQPVYEPFAGLIQQTGRTVVNNSLVCEQGRYRMNFEELEQLAAKPENKLLVLCSPHNPVGRVWRREELARLGRICKENGVLVVSDEIHSDIIYPGHKHTPFWTVEEDFAKHCIVCTAPGKTFNVAGLKMANTLIFDPDMRSRFDAQIKAMSLDVRNTFGLEGVAAAYSPEGEEWLEELLVYLKGNAELVRDYVQEHLPQVDFVEPEGTFLCWLDLTRTGLTDAEILKRVDVEAGVICVPGPWFGKGGERHLRLNIGCTRANLAAAMERIAQALQS